MNVLLAQAVVTLTLIGTKASPMQKLFKQYSQFLPLRLGLALENGNYLQQDELLGMQVCDSE